MLSNKCIDILIGVDVPAALEPEEIRKGKNGGPYAVKTKFGWTLNGPLRRINSHIRRESEWEIQCHFLTSNSDDSLEQQLKRYMNYEFSDSASNNQKSMSVEDRRALEVFEESVTLIDGHYQLAIPWKRNESDLPNNRTVAELRINYLTKKLRKDDGLLERYSKFIADLLLNDHARKVPEIALNDTNVWYLPHHNVVNPKKPEKTRVVFDCAAKYRGISLNSNVLSGPDLTNSLIGVLLRFRKESVAMLADIEAMFHQVRVHPKDVNFLRFLWYPNGDVNREPEEFQMLVHLFGGVWSPSCANYALRRTATDNKDAYGSEVINAVYDNFYVDDLLISVPTSRVAIDLYKGLKTLLKRGGFNLTKWTSNKRDVLDAIPESELSKDLKNLDLDRDVLPTERALGLHWETEKDTFEYRICVKNKSATRRGMLSVVSSLYDPLGFVAPFILRAKIILQKLCRMKLSWDEPIPKKEQEDWSQWLDELPMLQDLKVSRCLKPEDFGDSIVTELHHFADASEIGYGACSVHSSSQ